MTQLQTFGVTPADVQERISGLGITASFVGPTAAGIVQRIREAAAEVCGVLQAQRVPIPSTEAEAEILWINARRAVVSAAAAGVLSSRNSGGSPQLIGRLRAEANGVIETIIMAAPRVGSEATEPAAHQALFADPVETAGNFPRFFANTGGGL